MDIDNDSHRVSRLEVVDTGRRRRWSHEEKLRIVEESLIGHRQALATARRHGIPNSLLFRWRKEHREGRLGPCEARSGFVPAIVVPESPSPSVPAEGGCMEIVAHGGRRVIVGPDVEPAALARVLAVLEGR